MFPYPSGAGLHVGHPLGYIGTDVLARYQRMNGRHVMHALGYDAFGLPAEQYAIDSGQHPQVTTAANVATMRRQLRRLGLGHDARREIATTDVSFYRWTQWIFLQIFNSWVDERTGKARPIADLIAEFESGSRPVPGGVPWGSLPERERRAVIDGYRLAYSSEELVNWCPGPRHGAGQRGGHAGRAQRHRELPGLPPAAAAVDAPDHGVRRAADRRPGRPPVAGVHQAASAQLDRPQ